MHPGKRHLHKPLWPRASGRYSWKKRTQFKTAAKQLYISHLKPDLKNEKEPNS